MRERQAVSDFAPRIAAFTLQTGPTSGPEPLSPDIFLTPRRLSIIGRGSRVIFRRGTTGWDVTVTGLARRMMLLLPTATLCYLPLVKAPHPARSPHRTAAKRRQGAWSENTMPQPHRETLEKTWISFGTSLMCIVFF